MSVMARKSKKARSKPRKTFSYKRIKKLLKQK